MKQITKQERLSELKGYLSKQTVKKSICILLILTCIFSACSCTGGFTGNEESTAEEETTVKLMPDGVITMAYTSLDSVNPFVITSVLNSSLISLVYQPLYELDTGFMPQKKLVSKENIEGHSVRIELLQEIIFSDSSPLTSADVVYSFNKAKSAPLYSQALKNIEKCEQNGKYSVIFSLKQADVNVLNCLTFPIVKSGTAENDNSVPIGSGYYKFIKKDLRFSLECNLLYMGDLPKIGTIRLYDITDTSSLMHLLDMGTIDTFYSDLSDGEAQRTYSGATEIYLNNLVFLGLNKEHYRVSSTDIRRAVSFAIDRQAIIESAFLGHARATVFPFNTSWETIASSGFATAVSAATDLNTADTLLDTFSCGTNGNTVYFTLICSNSNSFMRNTCALIKEQLKKVNIEVTVNMLDEADFRNTLISGEYDMYLSEIKLSHNMDLSPFFDSKGAAAYGMTNTLSGLDECYFSYLTGSEELDKFLKEFYEEMPFIPICYRNGQLSYSRNITSAVISTERSLYSNIAEWTLAK